MLTFESLSSDGMRFHMLSHWSYLVTTLFGIVAFLGYLGAHALEGWLLFWGLFMVSPFAFLFDCSLVCLIVCVFVCLSVG